MIESIKKNTLVSIVITCYNHGKFLANAIESVLRQSHRNIQTIVVDDGSTDDTKEVALGFSGVTYVHQSNAGLSAARNKGLSLCLGEFVVFLDADDWLLMDAIKNNLDLISQRPEWAFVSGGHDKVDLHGNVLTDSQPVFPQSDHYCHLLNGNYIGMHASVMYRRSIVSSFQFDESLRACEDYDLYLRIARSHSVGSHACKVAVYRKHGANMSNNIPLMLRTVLLVLQRQKAFLRNEKEHAALTKGISVWKEYYTEQLFNTILLETERGTGWPSSESLKLLVREKPRKLFPLVIRKTKRVSARWLKSTLPTSAKRLLYRSGITQSFIPHQGTINTGDFDRTTPFSNDFGFDRGGAIDRYYIERFLSDHEQDVRGTVLEIGDNEYTLRFGKSRIEKSEILHVDHSNKKATIVGDITNLPNVPSGSFDTIILTQTLHLIYDFDKAVATCHRLLKPGGVLLITVPGISPIDKGPWKDYWLWSFTEVSITRVLKEVFCDQQVFTRTYGNVFVAASFLYGMGLPEFDKSKLDFCDPSYPVIIGARAIKETNYVKKNYSTMEALA